MTDFGAVLQGWARPQLRPMRPDGKGGYEKIPPWGETGLTPRVWNITLLWSISQGFRRRQFWRFGHVYLAPVFGTLNSSVEGCWLVEVLRVLDKAAFGKGPNARENLTVRLCHDRFQASTVPTADEKAVEQKHYDTLIDTYDKADLEVIRNRATFHLDYAEHQTSPRTTGDIEHLTAQLGAWFLAVATVHYKDPSLPRHMDTLRNRGRITARHYRRMMMTYYRAELGRPTRRRMDPKHLDYFPVMRDWPTPSEKDF